MFPDVCDDEIRGRKFLHWLERFMSFTIMQHGKVWSNRTQINQSSIWNCWEINLSFIYYDKFLLWCCIYSSVRQFMTIPSVENFATSQWYHSLNCQCISYLTVIRFWSKWRQKVTEVCNFWSWVWNFTMPSHRYASQCSVFKIKAKLTHKDMWLIGDFLIFYMVLFSLHSTP